MKVLMKMRSSDTGKAPDESLLVEKAESHILQQEI